MEPCKVKSIYSQACAFSCNFQRVIKIQSTVKKVDLTFESGNILGSLLLGIISQSNSDDVRTQFRYLPNKIVALVWDSKFWDFLTKYLPLSNSIDRLLTIFLCHFAFTVKGKNILCSFSTRRSNKSQ